MINWILPQYFSIGELRIHYYGILMALAVAAGYFLAIKRSKQYGIENKDADNIIFWLLIGGFVGARLYHVLSSWGYYYIYPLDILKVWNGGLSIYGAVIGGFVALYFAGKHSGSHYAVLKLADWLAPSLILGQIIGRFGNLFNYELYGYPTNLPWKMFVPPQFRALGYQTFSYFHPLFLYEALANAIILFLLLKVIQRTSASWRKGTLFFCYFLLYNAVRFGLEFLRIDSTYLNGIRINAYVSLLLVIISAIFLARRRYGKVS